MGDTAKNLLPEREPPVRVEPVIGSKLVRDAVQELIDSVPFEEPRKPVSDAPDWPDNFADVSDEELGAHLSYWSGMVAYAAYHVAIQDADRKALDWSHSRVFNETFVGVFDDSTTVTVAKAQADTEPDVVAAQEKQLAADTRFRVLQAVLSGFERKYEAASREITRRLSQRERKV
jgi:hypothetical protein